MKTLKTFVAACVSLFAAHPSLAQIPIKSTPLEPSFRFENGATFLITSACNDKVLSVQSASVAEGASVIVSADNRAPSQRWVAVTNSDNTISFKALHSNMALHGADVTASVGMPVAQRAVGVAANQRFRVWHTGQGLFRLAALHAPSKALDITSAAAADGTPVQLRDHASGCAQRWRIEKSTNAIMQLPAIDLPIEVLGPAGHIERVQFLLSDVSDATRLWVQCHRCAFRDASTNPRAKASVRINGGAWVNLDDATANVDTQFRQFGGIASALNTVSFSVPIAGLKTGANSAEFRFNTNDNLSSGYRILAMNVQRSDGTALLGAQAFNAVQPSLWPTQSDAMTVAAGKSLWERATSLRESPSSTKILNASCAMCHAEDGRDLKFFNYSNKSIVARSTFHGLTAAEGQQIAAFIRNLPNVPYAENARPWNPPYQPGPGLDAKPQHEWSAGAGLTAVLKDDSEMKPYLFPNGTSQQAIRDVMDINKTLNVREMPIALQFPDWNDWLPEKHPVDVLGADHLTKIVVLNRYSMDGYYEYIESTIRNSTLAEILENEWLGVHMHYFAEHSTDISALPQRDLFPKPDGTSLIDHLLSTLHWGAVKQWELMHTFGLEDKAHLVKGATAEPRSWFTNRRNVFELAPHRVAANSIHYPYQSPLVGVTKSTMWYQLQLTINAGNRAAYGQLWPVDWNYQPGHISDLRNKGGPRQPLRYWASHIKMHQQYHDGRPLATTNFGFRQTLPHRWVPGDSLGDDLPSEWRAAALSGMTNMLVDSVSVYNVADWRDGTASSGNQLEAITFVPELFSVPQLDGKCHERNYASCWYSVVAPLRAAGVDSATLNRYIDWSASIWPAGNWAALR